MERKRRDHIKESFTSLREAVPTLKGEKVVILKFLKYFLKHGVIDCDSQLPQQASRAQILKKTTECIQVMRRKIQANQKDVEDIKKQNAILEQQSKYI